MFSVWYDKNHNEESLSCAGVRYVPYGGFLGVSHENNGTTFIFATVFVFGPLNQAFSTFRTVDHLLIPLETCLLTIIEVVSNLTIFWKTIIKCAPTLVIRLHGCQTCMKVESISELTVHTQNPSEIMLSISVQNRKKRDG